MENNLKIVFIIISSLISQHSTAQSLTPDIINQKLSLTIFSAFTCSYSEKSAEIIAELHSEYPSELAIQFRNFPLSMGKNDIEVHLSAIAADNQGRFDQFYWLAYKYKRKRSTAEIARLLDLDELRFNLDREDSSSISKIRDDVQKAEALGVRVSPTIFIDGIKLEGLVDKATLVKIIESRLAKVKGQLPL